jgi:hypothetical protein
MITKLILACSDYSGDWLEAWRQFAVRDAIACPFTAEVGSLFVGLLIVAGINTTLYSRQGSIAIPAVVTLVTGGAWLTQVSGIASAFVVFVLLMLAGIAPVVVIRRIEEGL